MMTGDFLKNLNTNLGILSKSQRQIATGKVLNSISDDPVRLISSLQCKSKLSKLEHYKSTVNTALDWLDQTESSVSEINTIVKKAYETAVKMSNDYVSVDDKKAAAELVGQLRDHALMLANSQMSDKYIFGGYNVNKEPFTADGTGNIFYNGLDLTDETNPDLINMGAQSIEYEIGYNNSMEISITGTEFLGTGEDNIYSVLNNFYNALQSDANATELSGYITQLQDAQTNTLTTLSKVGGVTNRMELLQNRYEEETLTYKERKSVIEDVDIAEAYMNYSLAQTVYNSALQVGTEIIQRSILDYLR
jgi:flagellar hook-associated protein 3 FlgL